MSDTARILKEHIHVGRLKPVAYLPLSTIENVLKMRVEDYAHEVEKAGGTCVIFPEAETCIKSGAVYSYSKVDLGTVLAQHRELLAKHDWPQSPSAFIKRIAADWLNERSPLRFVVDAAFGNHPLSVKGVLIHDGRVLLLLNERGEWDLPGGRPDAGEEHRAALRREVREETGLDVEVGAALGEHLFEVLPDRFVRIQSFACRLLGSTEVALSHEHLKTRWVAVAELGERIAGHPLPAGYLGAIRQAMRQPLSSNERVV